jgi:hypothetical protein
MACANALAYKGRLVAGSEVVAAQRLQLPALHTLPNPIGGGQRDQHHWLRSALCHSSSVVVLDTDGMRQGNQEEAVHGNCTL